MESDLNMMFSLHILRVVSQRTSYVTSGSEGLVLEITAHIEGEFLKLESNLYLSHSLSQVMECLF